jgi:hypothetical protein
MRYHLTPAIIKKMKVVTADEDVEKRDDSYTVGGKCKLVWTLCKREWKFFKNLEIELPHDLVIP